MSRLHRAAGTATIALSMMGVSVSAASADQVSQTGRIRAVAPLVCAVRVVGTSYDANRREATAVIAEACNFSTTYVVQVDGAGSQYGLDLDGSPLFRDGRVSTFGPSLRLRTATVTNVSGDGRPFIRIALGAS